jgi:hypothetical protein
MGFFQLIDALELLLVHLVDCQQPEAQHRKGCDQEEIEAQGLFQGREEAHAAEGRSLAAKKQHCLGYCKVNAGVASMSGGWDRLFRKVSEMIDDTEQFTHPERLAQNIHGARLASLIEQRGFTEASHHNDPGIRAKIANLHQAFNTVHSGELDVHEGDIIGFVAEEVDGLFPGARDIDQAFTDTECDH